FADDAVIHVGIADHPLVVGRYMRAADHDQDVRINLLGNLRDLTSATVERREQKGNANGVRTEALDSGAYFIQCKPVHHAVFADVGDGIVSFCRAVDNLDFAALLLENRTDIAQSKREEGRLPRLKFWKNHGWEKELHPADRSREAVRSRQRRVRAGESASL